MAKSKSKGRSKKRGQAVGNLVGLMVALIIIIAVAYPIIRSAIGDGTGGLKSTMGLSGTSLAIADMIPLLILVAAIVLVTGLFTRD